MKRFTLSQESIQFQGTAFFDELVLAMTDIKKLTPKSAPDSEEVARLAKIIKHHTNMTTLVEFGDNDPQTRPPSVDKNHPLVVNYMRNHYSGADTIAQVQKTGGPVRGSVNLAKNWVDGIFAEMLIRIEMPVTMVGNDKFTAEEMAAILLHEVGHNFTLFEFMARTVTTNQMLAAASKELDGSGSVQEREMVLITLKKAMNLKNLDTDALAKSTDKRVVETVILTNIMRESESELGRNIYDSTSWEYLSDQYAARCGAYRHLVTGLEKIYKGHWNISFRSTPAFLFFEAVKIATIIVNPFITLLLVAMDGNDDRYDRPGGRIERIRSQVIENLKKKNLTADDNERLQADLKVINSLLEHINDRRQFFTVVWDTISPTARKNRGYQKLQQDLEVLVANNLFAQAAEFKLLIK